jgi:D-alanine-D-alanine ligase
MDNAKITVALILGGTSPEREVSKATGKSILSALRTLKFKVKVVDPAFGLNQPENEEDYFSGNNSIQMSNKNYIEVINSPLFDDVDIAFLALHGVWGEDGTIQSLLELRGIKYTGSKVLASSLGMDKVMTKIMLKYSGVETPKWITAVKGFDIKNILDEISNNFGYPCVIKPNDQGSTIGLTICGEADKVEEAINKALNLSSKALIEEYIPGRELTVAVLEQQALPVLEIKPKHTYYDYECKYTSGMSEYEVPAKISDSTAEFLQKQAVKAFNAIGCESYSRIDFRVTPDGNAFCLEINTLPGMTSTSLVPKMAKAAGISFEELISRIIKHSLK